MSKCNFQTVQCASVPHLWAVLCRASFFSSNAHITCCLLGIPGICLVVCGYVPWQQSTRTWMARCIHKPGRFTVPDPACSQLAIGRPMPPWQPSLPGAWPIFLPPRCCLFACYSQTLLLSLIRLQSESCYLQLPMPKPRPATPQDARTLASQPSSQKKRILHFYFLGKWFITKWCVKNQRHQKKKKKLPLHMQQKLLLLCFGSTGFNPLHDRSPIQRAKSSL